MYGDSLGDPVLARYQRVLRGQDRACGTICQINLVILLGWLCQESPRVVRLVRVCRSVFEASARRSGVEKEPDGSERWETRTYYAEGQFYVGPEEYGPGVVDNVVRVLEVFARDRVGGNDSRDAYCTHPT